MTPLRVGIDGVSLERWERAAFGRDVDEQLARAAGGRFRRGTGACSFAVKEAVLKCLGASMLLYRIEDIRVDGTDITLEGAVARRAARLGITQWLCSTARQRDMILAVVIAL